MTITQCDVCKSEKLVTGMFVTIRGEYEGKHVDAEATIDLCNDCKRRFISPVADRDTHIRVSKGG